MTLIKKFVWIDLEMTGLDAQKDVILEIATIITTPDLHNQINGPHFIISQPTEIMATMSKEVHELHHQSGLTKKVLLSTISLETAYRETFDFIKMHCKKNEAVLCGNSIWQDRLFLARYMPDIIAHLNYRLVDVSTIKVLVNNWYAQSPHVAFEKNKVHRALDDINESIAELKHYQHHFFTPTE